MKTQVVSAVALVLLSGVGHGDEPEKVKVERKALAGRWVCQSSEVDGIRRGAKESKDQTFAFDGEKFVQQDAATGDDFAGAYQLDLSGKQKVLATKVTVGTREVTLRYIYELDGDTLKVCGHLLPGKELPTVFSAPEGSKRMFAVFKRAKK
jgi:uncharacterized protein (TIGR03067 family)